MKWLTVVLLLGLVFVAGCSDDPFFVPIDHCPVGAYCESVNVNGTAYLNISEFASGVYYLRVQN